MPFVTDEFAAFILGGGRCRVDGFRKNLLVRGGRLDLGRRWRPPPLRPEVDAQTVTHRTAAIPIGLCSARLTFMELGKFDDYYMRPNDPRTLFTRLA